MLAIEEKWIDDEMIGEKLKIQFVQKFRRETKKDLL